MKFYISNKSHIKYSQVICENIAESAKVRGTGIAKRTPEYIQKKISEQKAIIALDKDTFAGFCYIETWGNDQFIANSGLIVAQEYRNQGLAKEIKKRIFEYSKKKYPNAKFFGITTGLAVMKINNQLGYKPVTFSELPKDDEFWKGCETCKNFDILSRTERKMCLCTGMLYDPNDKKIRRWYNEKVLKRLKKLKQTLIERK